MVVGETSPLHSLPCEKANKRRMLVLWPGFVNYQTLPCKSAIISAPTLMFENIDSAKPERHWLLWTSLKAIGLGIACFPSVLSFSSDYDPMVKHHWAERGRRCCGLAQPISELRQPCCAVYILRRTIRATGKAAPGAMVKWPDSSTIACPIHGYTSWATMSWFIKKSLRARRRSGKARGGIALPRSG
jgi:hypothetical protein